jgi:hypothetical protein
MNIRIDINNKVPSNVAVNISISNSETFKQQNMISEIASTWLSEVENKNLNYSGDPVSIFGETNIVYIIIGIAAILTGVGFCVFPLPEGAVEADHLPQNNLNGLNFLGANGIDYGNNDDTYIPLRYT